MLLNTINLSKHKNNFFIIFISIFFSTSLYAEKLTLGVFPYYDATRLASLHKPLKEYLASSTNNNIRLVSAPNFKIFKERTKLAKYDIIVTAPHFGRDAQNFAEYEWIGFTSNTSYAVFVSHINSGIKSIKDLKDKTLALPPKGAIIHHLALNTLKDNSLKLNKDLKGSIQKSHNNAMLSVILKNADAAAFGAPTWKKYNSPDKNKLQMIGKSENIPGFAIMVHSSVSSKIKKDLKKALFLFSSTQKGKDYFNKTGLKGIREKTAKDIELLDSCIKAMRISK